MTLKLYCINEANKTVPENLVIWCFAFIYGYLLKSYEASLLQGE